jgi:hypothetical protein
MTRFDFHVEVVIGAGESDYANASSSVQSLRRWHGLLAGVVPIVHQRAHHPRRKFLTRLRCNAGLPSVQISQQGCQQAPLGLEASERRPLDLRLWSS